MPPHLSTSSSDPGKTRAIAWAITIGLISVFELSVFIFLPKQTPIEEGVRFYPAGISRTFTDSLLQWQTHRALNTEGPVDIMIMGDSSATMGVIPAELDKLNIKVENFGLVLWMTIDGHTDLLEHYLKNHQPPKLIIYCFTDGLFSDNSLIEKGMLTSYRSWLGLDQGPEIFWPTYSLRPLALKLRGGTIYEELPNDSGVRTFLENHYGFLRESRIKPEITIEDQPIIPIVPQSIPGLIRFFSTTSKHKITVLFMHSPMPDLFNIGSIREKHLKNKKLLSDLIQHYPHITLGSPYLNYAPTQFFIDYNHLSLRGAIINSKVILQWLEKNGYKKMAI